MINNLPPHVRKVFDFSSILSGGIVDDFDEDHDTCATNTLNNFYFKFTLKIG